MQSLIAARRSFLRLLALLLSALFTTAAAQPQLPQRFQKIREMIGVELKKQAIPSLAVAVARDGEILWEEAFGWADRANEAAASPRTAYSLASISKPITATGLMILVERGQVHLDRPINDYLGPSKLHSYAGDAAGATVRRVASHTAGLPLHYQFFLANEAYPRPSMEETIRRYGILVRKPGERYRYSNIGYGLLDHVIERVSGKRYSEFMREEVFLPLGLTATSVPTRPDPGRSWAVRYWDGSTALPFYDFDHRGGSAVFASAHDLVRFGMFHLKAGLPGKNQILSKKSIDLMQRPIATRNDGGRYGIGWTIYPNRGGHRIVQHGGSMGGVRTILSLVPAKNIAVAVLSNTQTPFVDQITDEILGTLLPGYGRLRRQQSQEREPTCEQARAPAKPSLPKELLGVWIGLVKTYSGQIPLKLWLRKAGASEARLGEQETTAIRGLRVCKDYLIGALEGDIGTKDANRRRYSLHFALRHEGTALKGPLTAVSVPGPKLGNALTSWAELAWAKP